MLSFAMDRTSIDLMQLNFPLLPSKFFIERTLLISEGNSMLQVRWISLIESMCECKSQFASVSNIKSRSGCISQFVPVFLGKKHKVAPQDTNRVKSRRVLHNKDVLNV